MMPPHAADTAPFEAEGCDADRTDRTRCFARPHHSRHGTEGRGSDVGRAGRDNDARLCSPGPGLGNERHRLRFIQSLTGLHTPFRASPAGQRAHSGATPAL